MGKLFGTDGVRGVANTELTAEIAFKLGQAAAAFLGSTIVVGKDTRLSGDMLESALAAGAMSMGATVLSAGVIPTPAVAFLVRELSADGGVVISASHNPPEYNGIKFFDASGFKLSEEKEAAVEAMVLGEPIDVSERPGGVEVGTFIPLESAQDLYIAHAVNHIREQNIDFSGWKIALDAAHGASVVSTQFALESLGAEVITINDEFDGTDINVACGSTHLEPLKELVKTTGAHIGIAHDGDADRVLFVSAEGEEIDGDMVEAACALDLKAQGRLAGDTVVSTVMCNLGFVRAMEAAGIRVLQTKVGDRHVLEAMREGGYILGGEQSGHTIFLEANSTGDGLMTACNFLAACVRMDKTPGEAAQLMTRYPQELINVRVAEKGAFETNEAIKAAVSEAERAMGETGRVLVRESGTEPLVRVMVEAETAESARMHAQAIAAIVTEQIGEK